MEKHCICSVSLFLRGIMSPKPPTRKAVTDNVCDCFVVYIRNEKNIRCIRGGQVPCAFPLCKNVPPVLHCFGRKLTLPPAKGETIQIKILHICRSDHILSADFIINNLETYPKQNRYEHCS